MKNFIYIAVLFFAVTLNAQIKEVTITELVESVETLDFKPVQRLKQLDRKEVKKFLLTVIDDKMLKQLNIDAWYLCKNNNERGFQIYNLYYETITQSIYNNNCKPLNILMLIDGVIKQPQ